MNIDVKVNGKAVAASIQPSPELVNAILKWSVSDRRDLAFLLIDSVREGFTSLEEAEEKQKNLIHDRIEQLKSGEAELVEPEDVFSEMRRRIAEVRSR